MFRSKTVVKGCESSCNKTEAEANHLIYEQIIPAKTKKSGGVRQYNPKNVVRARQSEMIYSFFLWG